jgi:hypothetical protein
MTSHVRPGPCKPRTTRRLTTIERLACGSFTTYWVGRKRQLEKWIVYRGERKQRFDNGVVAWPVLEALAALR